MWEKALVTWKPAMGAFPQGEAVVLPFHLSVLSPRREGLESEKPERNCVRVRTGSHSLKNDSVLGPSHNLHISGIYFFLVYSTEFEDDNAHKKKNSNDHALNTYV